MRNRTELTRASLPPLAFALLVLVLPSLAGCGAGDETHGGAPRSPIGEVPGVYAGRLPCTNCVAISATLWLRDDGRFFLRQTYIDEDPALAESTYALGLWRWNAAEGVLELTGRGPQRRLAQLDAQRLELETASPLKHILTRVEPAPAFTDASRLRGQTVLRDGSVGFTECVTGLSLEVAAGPGRDELRRQHRRMNRGGAPALTVVDARIEPATSEAGPRETLVVERVVDLIRPRVTC